MCCYNFKKIVYNIGLFDEFVDATYIIHLEGNGRLESILNQINTYKPSNTVYIVFDKGYRKCFKKGVSTIAHDIIVCNIEIFKHSLVNNYNNILVLEDDFIFSEKMKKNEVIININNFIKNCTKEEYIYGLGVFLSLRLDLYKNNTSLAISWGASHALIYNKKIRKSLIIDYNLNKIQLPIDIYLSLKYRCYIYNEPLCYQLFPETENQKNWHLMPDGSSNLFMSALAIIGKKYMKFLELDKNVEPGYSTMYKISLITTYLLILILLIILSIIIYYVYKLIYLKNKKIIKVKINYKK